MSSKQLDWEKYLKQIYFNPLNPASFQGPQKLYHYVKKDKKFNLSHAQINNWLQKQESFSRNKKLLRNFNRRRVIVGGINDQFEIDLASFVPYARYNQNYQYLLAVIDVFSRYAWVVPIKNKTSKYVIQELEKIFNSGRRPLRIRSDAGAEFTSNEFENFIKRKNIHHFTTHNEKQANYVERFIKTIKSKIYRYMIQNNTKKYINILPKLVKSYNETWHSGIKMEPKNVTEENERQLWWQMYMMKKPLPSAQFIAKYRKMKPSEKIKFKFSIGDNVRISYLRSPFQREYDAKWSAEVFCIIKRNFVEGFPIYKVVDLKEIPLKGSFYEKELQKVEIIPDALYKIEKIVKKRKQGRKTFYKVKWEGWPSSFNQWIEESEIKNISEN